MGCPPRPVDKRTRLEVSLEDGFQDELDGSLDHAVANARNTQDADLAPVFGYLLPSVPHRTIRVCSQFVPDLQKERLDSALLDGLEGDPVNAGSTVVLLGQRVSFVKGFHLADVDVQAPAAPGRVG